MHDAREDFCKNCKPMEKLIIDLASTPPARNHKPLESSKYEDLATTRCSRNYSQLDL